MNWCAISTKELLPMKTAVKATKRPPRRFTASEKCRAVLLVWTEKRSATQLARELGLTWTVLSQWQEQAMAGMLGAMEPRQRTEPKPCPLNARLQQLLDRKSPRPGPEIPARPAGLAKRPAELQETAAAEPPSPKP